MPPKPHTLTDIESMATRGLAAVEDAEKHSGLTRIESWQAMQRAHADARMAFRSIIDRCKHDR